MAEFVYAITKNMNHDHISFKLNSGHHLCIFFEDEVDSYLKSRSANKLAKKFRKMMFIC